MIEEGLTLTIICFSLSASLLSALLPRRVKASSTLSSALNSIASALMIYVGLRTLLTCPGKALTFTLLKGIPSPSSSLVLGYDWLTSVLVMLLGFISLMVSIYSARHYVFYGTEGDVRGLTSVLPIFTLSMFLVLTARDALWFFVFWEVMTLSSLALILYEYGEAMVRFSGLLYAIAMHVGALSLLVGLLILASLTPTHSFSFSSLALVAHTLTGNRLVYLALALITVGFLFKAGVAPLHLWLPDAHSVAPSNVSALLSGLMVKIGVYGVMRYVLILLSPCVNLTYSLTLMGLATLSVVVGAAYAAVQNNYKRLLAFSTVENVGIIMLAVSAASLGLAQGLKWLYCLGMAAALFHMVNHSVFKSLMFLNAGTLLRATGIKNLNRLGGLASKLRVTALTSFIGTLAASAMPPLNGFASKFVIYEVLLMGAASLVTWYSRLPLLLSAVALIISGVLTMIAFSKFYGSTFLGQGPNVRLSEGESVVESFATLTLSASCIVLAVTSPAILHYLVAVQHALPRSPVINYSGIAMALGAGIWRSPAIASYAVLSGVMLFAFAALLGIYGRGLTRSRMEPFVSGVKYINAYHRPRADTLTQLLREYFAALLGVRKVVKREYLVKYWTTGELEYRVTLGRHLLSKSLRLRERGEFFERFFYAPPYRFFKWLGSKFRNLQSGSLLLYITYIYLAYLILLGLIAWLR